VVRCVYVTVIAKGGWSDFCFFQEEEGIRELVRSRGLGDV